MPPPFDEACCARIPREALALLAWLRVEPGLHACCTDEHAWLRWDAGNSRVLESVLPIHGVVLFAFHEGCWHRHGQALPAFDFPAELRFQPLAHLLFPAPVLAIPVPTHGAQAVRLTLERDDRPRGTTAMRCPLTAFLTWSDTVGAHRLAACRGAFCAADLLVRGNNLPILDNTQRYWGHDVLIPLGLAPNVVLAESVLREAAAVPDDALLLWEPDRIEAIPRSLFAPLTRAGLRRAICEAR